VYFWFFFFSSRKKNQFRKFFVFKNSQNFHENKPKVESVFIQKKKISLSTMTARVAGVGAGLFAVILVTAIAVLIGLVMAFLQPEKAIPIFFACLMLPVLVFALIMAAPLQSEQETVDVIEDEGFIPKMLFYVVMILTGLVGPVYYFGVVILGAKPYEAPDVACRRKKMQEIHPTWYAEKQLE
jgi:hypothetical protein